MLHTTILRTVAEKLGTRVRNCQEFDPNVCRFAVDADHQWRPFAVSGYPFSQEIRLVHNGRRIAVSANPDYLRIKVEGELIVNGVLSINKANKTQSMERTPLRIKDDARWPVFTSDQARGSSEIRSLLESSALHDAVEQLLADKADSLHIFEGAVVLYSKARDADQLMNDITTLSRLVGPLRRQDSSTYLKVLPTRFHYLIPLILKWAESDDQERAALLDRSSKDSLGELAKAIASEFDAINEYLDSFRYERMPEAATALGRLAESATEAQLRLSRTVEEEY
jgi:hypothetical protein